MRGVARLATVRIGRSFAARKVVRGPSRPGRPPYGQAVWAGTVRRGATEGEWRGPGPAAV